MINIIPNSILVDFGFVKIYWYGFIISLGILISLFFVHKVAKQKKYNLKKLEDLYFYAIIFGLIGARLYEVFFFNWSYYQHNLINIFKVWEGGLAIQGTILFGVLTVYIFCKKNKSPHFKKSGGDKLSQLKGKCGDKLKFFQYTDLLVLGLILGQAIGRWGNFFNQELYGRISSLPWAIYIERTGLFHHPVFLYESILNLILFFILYQVFKKQQKFGLTTLLYIGGYSLIRFLMEFIRIDHCPIILGIRLPQLISFLVIIAVVLFYLFKFRDKKK